MTTSTYTLQSDGILTTTADDTDTVISGQWWTTSPNAVAGIGNFYQVLMSTVSADGGTLSGTFGQWVPLSSDQAWSFESEDANTARLFVQIRDIATMTVQQTATIFLNTESTADTSYFDLIDSLSPSINLIMDDDDLGIDSTGGTNFTESATMSTIARTGFPSNPVGNFLSTGYLFAERPAVDPLEDLTLVSWFQLNSFPPEGASFGYTIMICGPDISDETPAGNTTFSVRLVTTGGLQFIQLFHEHGSGINVVFTTEWFPELNTTYNLTVDRDNTLRQYHINLQGVEIFEGVYSAASVPTGGGNLFWVGAHERTAINWLFDGYLSNVSLFETMLAQSDILNIYDTIASSDVVLTSRINIGLVPAADTFGSWTNLLSKTIGTSVSILDFSNGDDTGWTLTITDEAPFDSISGGVNAVGTSTAAWVDEALVSLDGQIASAGDGGKYTFSGLNDAETYNIKVFGSRSTLDNFRVSEFSLDAFATNQRLDASGNSTLVVIFYDVSPVSGVIDLSFRGAPSSFCYINAVEIALNP